MEMVRFRSGNHEFWVKDPKKIKHWRGLANITGANVVELKKREINEN